MPWPAMTASATWMTRPLYFLAHCPIGSGVEQNAVQVQAGFPNCGITMPGSIRTDAVSLKAQSQQSSSAVPLSTPSRRRRAHKHVPRGNSGVEAWGEGNPDLQRPRGTDGMEKRARSARKKATGCMMRSAAGFKMEIPVYRKCREFQTGSLVISYLKPR